MSVPGESARMAGTAANDLPLPRMHQTTQGDVMSNDDRVQRYVEAALGEKESGVNVLMLRGYTYEQSRRVRDVIAVADAEQAELGAEVERLTHRLAKAEGSRDMLIEAHRKQSRFADQSIARADAAERALADERATIAQYLRTPHKFAGLCPEPWNPDVRDPECPACALLHKLAGPEPEATAGGDS